MSLRRRKLMLLTCWTLLVGGCAASSGDVKYARAADSNEGTAASSQEARGFLRSAETRAMWLWSDDPTARALLDNTDGAQDELFEFVQAPHGQRSRAINRLFFEARDYDKSERLSKLRPLNFDPLSDAAAQDKLRSFLRRAHAAGVAVEYLDGQAIWLASDENAKVAESVCEQVVDFNRATGDPRERFDGVHLDIEPHTVTEGPYAGVWWEKRLPDGYNREWTARWKEILNACRDSLDAYQEQTGHRLTLAVDLGADFARYNEPMRAFLDRKDAPIDYASIMNYYDNRPNRDERPSFFFGAHDGEEVVGGVEQNLARWRHAPLLFGLETGPAAIAPDPRSFHQEGYAALHRTVDELVDNYGSTQCIGAAIHHYGPEAYRDLSR